jgi:hypothetical protein
MTQLKTIILKHMSHHLQTSTLANVSEHSLFHLHTYPPMKAEQTVCFKTLAYKIQMPGNYPEESIQHSEHGESLKSSKLKTDPVWGLEVSFTL